MLVHKHLGASATWNVHNGTCVLKDLKTGSSLHSQTNCSVENMSEEKGKDMCDFFKIFFGLIFPKWSLLFLFCLRVTYSWNWPKEVSELGPFSTVSHELGGEHQEENFLACCCWGVLRGLISVRIWGREISILDWWPQAFLTLKCFFTIQNSMNQYNKALLAWQNIFNKTSENKFPSFSRHLLNSIEMKESFQFVW